MKASLAVMAGLVPAIHVFAIFRGRQRGCPGQARAWRSWSTVAL